MLRRQGTDNLKKERGCRMTRRFAAAPGIYRTYLPQVPPSASLTACAICGSSFPPEQILFQL